ncbi:MAG: hypothetical protein IJZ57_10515 [Clostridia bacterium]|nr:hypothetical protein [Clostridia bacterium]
MLQREAIKSYLEKAVPKGLSLKKQMNICDELTCHIQDKADFYMEIGYEEEKSYEKALEEMGDGEEVCQQFEEVYQEKTIHAVLTSVAIHFADFVAVILGFGLSFVSIFASSTGMIESAESVLFSSVALCAVLVLIMYAHKERHPKMLKAIGISHLIMTFLTGVLNSIYAPLAFPIGNILSDFFADSIWSILSPIFISFPIGFTCLILSKAVKHKKGVSEKAFKALSVLFVAGLVVLNSFSFYFNYSSISEYIVQKNELNSYTGAYESITSEMTFEEADKSLKATGYIPSTEFKKEAVKDEYLGYALQNVSEEWSLSENDIIYMKRSETGEIAYSEPCIIIPQSQDKTIPWKIIDFRSSPSNINLFKEFTILNSEPVTEAKEILNSLHIGYKEDDCIKSITRRFSFQNIKTEYTENIASQAYRFFASNFDSIGDETLRLEATLVFKNNRLSKGSYILTHIHKEFDDMGICFDVKEKEEHLIK